MDSIASFFKKENDIFDTLGRRDEKINAIKNLLASERLTIAEIAVFTNTTEEFIKK